MSKKSDYNISQEKLNHAYLILGQRDIVLAKLLEDIENELGIEKSKNNPDVFILNKEFLNIEDSRNLKSITNKKPIKEKLNLFLISFDKILFQAGEALLKIAEEMQENNHIFFITESTGGIAETLISRLFIVHDREFKDEKNVWAKDFIKSNIKTRQEMVNLMLKKIEEQELTRQDLRNILIDIHDQVSLLKDSKQKDALKFILKSMSWIRDTGSSPKIIFESLVALI